MATYDYEKGRLNLPFIDADLVEVALPYDPVEVTAALAAQVLLNLLGSVFEGGNGGSTGPA